jgi:hypothetical protein
MAEEHIEIFLTQIRNEKGPYASYQARLQLERGPWQVFDGAKNEDPFALCANHYAERRDNGEAITKVHDDDGVVALEDTCDDCEVERKRKREEKIEEWMEGRLGNRSWNDIEGDSTGELFLHHFPFYAELAGPVNWYINVYDRQGKMYFLHLEEILNYAVESAVSAHTSIGQDGYFSISQIQEDMDANIAQAEMLEAAAKDLRAISAQTKQIHG